MKTAFCTTLILFSITCFSQTRDKETIVIIDSISTYYGQNDLPKDLTNYDKTPNDSLYWISLGQKEYSGDYLKLDNKIYCGSLSCYTTPLNIDISSFKILHSTSYSKDKNNVYYYNNLTCEDCFGCCGGCSCNIFIVENATPATFRLISSNYATDGKNIFYEGCMIVQADIQTFKVLDTPKDLDFAVDKNHVYKRNEIFKEAESATFYCNKTNYEYLLIIGDKYNKWEYDFLKNTITRIHK